MIDLANTNLNFLDIETTGTNFKRDKITEIYISKCRNEEVLDTFHSLINPERTLEPYITSLTGINNEMLKNAPTFEEIAEEIFQFLNEELIVAHNARFDYSFLKHNLNNFGYIVDMNYCCTVKLSRLLNPQYTSHSLSSIIKRLNFQSGDRHRAKYDTEAVKTFFYNSLNQDQDKFNNAFEIAIKKSAIPPALLKIKMEDIPKSPGVYLFYGKEELPIYIGMSKNLQRRIYEHFYQDLTLTKDFKINQQLERIEFIETAGILGASLREAFLIKKYQPLYNRMLRKNSVMIRLDSFIDGNGYINLSYQKDDTIMLEYQNTLISYFRDKRELQNKLNNLVKEKGLCPKLLGLEKGTGACFSYQLGYCKGACCRKISPQEYNQLLNTAISKIKIQNWPFKGKKIITEVSNKKRETLTFNNWGLVGSSVKDPIYEESNKSKFDIDTYKILIRYLKSQKKISLE